MVFPIFDRLLECRSDERVGRTHQGKGFNQKAMLFENCLQSDQRLFRHGRYAFPTDQDVVVLMKQLRQALAVVLDALLFLILGRL